MSNTTNTTSTSAAIPQATISTNATSQPPSSAASGSNSSMQTILTFGPLSSCLDLPILPTTSNPLTHHTTTSSPQQFQTWLASLPSTTTCTPLSWTLRPDYSSHVDAVMTFRDQLIDLFPATTNASFNTSATTAAGGFFTGNSSSLLTGSGGQGVLPETLPLWIGVTLAIATLVNLLAVVLHVASDLDALFPSLAVKLNGQTDELPVHSETVTTVVQDSDDVDVKVEPPQYSAPAEETPALLRISRKVKKLVVPLLLFSALGLVGVAVVLNAKFAFGPVGTPEALASKSVAATPTVSAGNSSTSDVSISRASSTTRSTPVAATATATRIDEGVRNSTSVASPSSASSMVKMVRRQTNFFPTPSFTDLSATSTAIAAVPSSSLTSSSTSASAVASTASEPNASLFPPTTTTTSFTPIPATPSSPAPTSTTTQSSPTPAPSSSPTTSSPLVLQRGDSTHRLWWIIMLDLVLWFAQRRRTRSQMALDTAKAIVVRQLGGGVKK